MAKPWKMCKCGHPTVSHYGLWSRCKVSGCKCLRFEERKTRKMRTRDKEILRRNVERGAKFLTDHQEAIPEFQNWWRKVQINELNMADGSTCMIGQLMQSYLSGLEKIAYANGYIKKSANGYMNHVDAENWAYRHGFVIKDRRKWHKVSNEYFLQWGSDKLDDEGQHWVSISDDSHTTEGYAELDELWKSRITAELMIDALGKKKEGSNE